LAKLKAFSNTSVSLFKTQDDLEKLLSRHGIKKSRWSHFAEGEDEPGTVRFEFEWLRDASSVLGFRLEVSYQYEAGPRGGNQGTTREQAGRALFWHIKNLFDAVDYGIVDLEQAFMPHLLTDGDDGPTLYEQLAPKLGMPLLTAGKA